MTGDIFDRIDALIRRRKLRWARNGKTITVELAGSRRQRVEITRRGEVYVFRSVALRAGQLPPRMSRADLAYRAWRRNTVSELVTFALDDHDTLVGIIEQPIATLDPEELEAYVETLAVECDRLEYALTGADAT